MIATECTEALLWLSAECGGAIPDVVPRVLRRPYYEHFGFAIITVEALIAICGHVVGRVADLGAGNGYLSYLLQQRGVDVHATDAVPASTGENHYWPGDKRRAWCTIEALTAAQAAATADSLIVSWPEHEHDVLGDALEAFAGAVLVYIGEGRNECCDPERRFFEILERKWSRCAFVRLPHFNGYFDNVSIFARIRA
jgi:hypothetical protein